MEISSPEMVASLSTGAATTPPLADDSVSTASFSHGNSDAGRTKHGRKRDRVALACQRCKAKKQKCDGLRPNCAGCARLGQKCVYIVPLVPAAGEKKLYIKALEQRVAELESQLASLGQRGVGEDHLRLRASSTMLPPHEGETLYHLAPLPKVTQTQHAGSPTVADDDDDERDDILVAVRDLSLSASGHYVGAASNITIGRVLSSVVHSLQPPRPVSSSLPSSNSAFPTSRLAGGGRRRQEAESHDNPNPNSQNSQNSQQPQHDDNDPTPKSLCTTTRMADMIGVPFLSPQVAQRLMHGWFTHIATRYPVLLTPKVLALHESRDWLVDVYEKSILHLIYAVSGRWLESSGEMGHFFSDQHYDLAFEAMDTILQYRDSRTIDYLILMAVYCTRAPRDPGAWTYVGAAMRLCVELGLHRKQRRRIPSVEGEMNKRRFWTAYFLDRDISIALGRPPSISDHDIDADLPLDVDEATDDDDIIRQAAALQLQQLNHHGRFFLRNPPTTLGPFIHRLQLKRIESEIQHAVYRVDRPAQVSDAVINGFLDRLDAWKDAIPAETRNFQWHPGKPYDGPEFYTIHYYRCVRFLLFPRLASTSTSTTPKRGDGNMGTGRRGSSEHNPQPLQSGPQNETINMHYLRLCSSACAGIVRDYRRLHRAFALGFSALSIQTVFLAGLTLIYCAWLAPTGSVGTILNVDVPLTDCQILLYIITERYPSARKYRDVFERTKLAVMSLIARGEHRPQSPVHLDLDLDSLDFFDTNLRMAAVRGAMRQESNKDDTAPPEDVVTGPHPRMNAVVHDTDAGEANPGPAMNPMDCAAAPWEMIGMGADFSHMISQMTGQSVDDPVGEIGSLIGGLIPQMSMGGNIDMTDVFWTHRRGDSGGGANGYGGDTLNLGAINDIYYARPAGK